MDKHKNAFAIITLLAVTAVTSPVSAQDDLRILRRGIAGDPESLDPHRLLSAFESTIMTDMFIALATTAPGRQPDPWVSGILDRERRRIDLYLQYARWGCCGRTAHH